MGVKGVITSIQDVEDYGFVINDKLFAIGVFYGGIKLLHELCLNQLDNESTLTHPFFSHHCYLDLSRFGFHLS